MANESKSGVQQRDKINIVHKVCGLNYHYTAIWLSNEYFRTEITMMLARGETLTKQNILEVMERVYDVMNEDRSKHPDFNYYNARRTIKKLRQSILSS